METAGYWICEMMFAVSGLLYVYMMERRTYFVRLLLLWSLMYTCFVVVLNLLPVHMLLECQFFIRLSGYCLLVILQHSCFQITWSVAVCNSIWSVMSWQLLCEIWVSMRGSGGSSFFHTAYGQALTAFLIFSAGYLICAFTIAVWIRDGGPGKIGPRQLTSALLLFGIFEMITLRPGSIAAKPAETQVIYLSQLLLAVVLYLQNELFKKSAMRQELAVMNLLWKKEQEQYQLSKENIALINQKCHDLKHQIHAVRNASREDIDKYLEEMEQSVRIYESIVKTGNEVLDTILTEKSLYCKERGITVSCVADGSQMQFINTVDLYAILGNALDNAMEAVEKFSHEEKRQIDVLIYREKHFLVINVINPRKENLVYEEELPVSTKGDRRYHGFGLRSMQYLVKKYDGYLNISEEDGCFSLKILIPIQE